MSTPQSFFRYVADRYRGRLSTAKHSAMTTFVLTTAAGEELTNAKFWFGAMRGLFLYAIRVARALFDSAFEAIGFLLGHLLLPWPLLVRIIVALAALIWVCSSITGQSGWFITSCVGLFALDLLPALVTRTLAEPRLIAASVRAYSLVAVTFWAWQSGWPEALLGFLLTRRAFRFFNEGMTICAAELAQIRRDRLTEALVQAIKTEQHPEERIILYLRPFVITDRMKMDEGKFLEAADHAAITEEHDPDTNKWRRTIMPVVTFEIGVSEAVSLFEQGAEFEATIEQAMRGAGHLIALGRPGEAIGAGRLPSLESEWRETVRLMIEQAMLCIVIPSANAGTLWEIEYLVDNDHLGKCCVFMPPAIGKFSYETAWRAAREALATKLPLPEYQPNGGLFRCDGKIPTELPKIEWMPKNAAEMFALGVQLLFPELPPWNVKASPSWFRFGFFASMTTSIGRSEGNS